MSRYSNDDADDADNDDDALSYPGNALPLQLLLLLLLLLWLFLPSTPMADRSRFRLRLVVEVLVHSAAFKASVAGCEDPIMRMLLVLLW